MDAMECRARIDLADLIEPFACIAFMDCMDFIAFIEGFMVNDLTDFIDDFGINFLECTDRIDGLDRIDWAARRERNSGFFAASKCCTNDLVASGAGRFACGACGACGACLACLTCVSTSGCGGACRWG